MRVGQERFLDSPSLKPRGRMRNQGTIMYFGVLFSENNFSQTTEIKIVIRASGNSDMDLSD